MSIPGRQATSSRAPLSRDRVLQAAMALADGGGIEALSMRRLGQELGVEAMSLYNHVANKDDILNGILELAMQEIELPDTAGDWKAEIRRSAVSAHRTLLRHPWACAILMEPARVSVSRLRWMDAVLGTFRKADFSAKLTHHAYHALDSHITGFTMWVLSLPATGDELKDVAADFLEGFPVDDYPYLVEHMYYHLEDEGDDDQSEFEFGLGLILDGLERIRNAG